MVGLGAGTATLKVGKYVTDNSGAEQGSETAAAVVPEGRTLWTEENLPESELKKEFSKLSPMAKETALSVLNKLNPPRNNFGSLHADKTGRLFYACEGLAKAQGSESLPPAPKSNPSAKATSASKIPVSSPPIRHSRPGAEATIYLDFNGGKVSGTAWVAGGTRQCIPLDTDGDPTTFNEDEQNLIVRVWEAVSEDFLPFQVNVTTEPPEAITVNTTWVLITHSTDATGLKNPWPTAGGVAYIGVFGLWGSNTLYSPAFVYYNNVGSSPGSIAEAASHEAGHTLGLSHDGTSTREYYKGHGTGETSWAPIMGTAYGKNVTHWSKGEYFDANNTEDDIAILTETLAQAGINPPALAAGGAERVPATGTVSGTLTCSDEKNSYAFSAYSTAVIKLTPKRLSGTAGGNLDGAVEILDGKGKVVAFLNPENSTGITTTMALAAGDYVAKVGGIGWGNPMDPTPSGYTKYGSFGSYTLEVASDLNPYQNWESGNKIEGGPAGDTDKDGITNLTEYAFGLKSQGSDDAKKLPQQAFVTSAGKKYLATTFRRLTGNGVTYRVQQSQDLKRWDPVDLGANTTQTTPDLDGYDLVTIRSTLPVGETPRLFLRIVVAL